MLRLRLLGSFELRGPSDRPLKITARKTRALLAFLALQNGAPQSRERLAALLWEDADAELARSSLRQALTALRRALPAKLHALVEADAQQVALNLAQVAGGRACAARTPRRGSVGSLKAARRIAAEPLLEGFDARSGAFEEWVAAERRTLRRDLAAAAAKLAALCRDAGDADGEIDALDWLLTLEPLAEGAHRELMACFARAGRYTEALAPVPALPHRAAPRARPRAGSRNRGALSRAHEEAPRRRERAAVRAARRRTRGRGRDANSPAKRPHPPPATIACCRRASCSPCGCPDSPRSGARSTRRNCASSRSACSALFDEAVSLHGGVADRLSGDRLNRRLRTREPERQRAAARAARRAGACIHAVGASDLTPGAPAIGIAQGALLPTRIERAVPALRRPDDAMPSRSPGRRIPAKCCSPTTCAARSARTTCRFAGRHAELSLMTSLLERCVATRRGRTIVTRGDAGIGKTRLLEALEDAARAHGIACHRVQVLDFGQVKARRPLAALFASLLGVAADAGPAERGRAVVEAIDVRPPAGRQHPARERTGRRAAVRRPGLDRAQSWTAGARARPHRRSCGG